PQSLSPSIKSLNYLNNIMARVEANQYGADEALMLDIHGYVSEATAENFFIIRNSTIVTPWTSTNLPGVTRETVLEIVPQLGLKAEERLFTLYDAWSADETFISGTAAEIGPVVALQGRRNQARGFAGRGPGGCRANPRNGHPWVSRETGVPRGTARHRTGALRRPHHRSLGPRAAIHGEREGRDRHRGRPARPNLHGTHPGGDRDPTVRSPKPTERARASQRTRRPSRVRRPERV